MAGLNHHSQDHGLSYSPHVPSITSPTPSAVTPAAHHKGFSQTKAALVYNFTYSVVTVEHPVLQVLAHKPPAEVE